MHRPIAPNGNPNPPPQPKPIRFVANNDGPYAKRRRINSACLTCRRRKTRCSGERPVCRTCTQNRHECGGYGTDADQSNHVSPAAGDRRDEVKASSQSREAGSPQQRSSSETTPIQVSASNVVAESTLPSTAAPSRPTSNAGDGSGRDRPGLSLTTRNRMPYFRYFGPTAIMPGFKQMVVKVKGKQHSTAASTSEVTEAPSAQPTAGQVSPVNQTNEARTPLEIPVYDTSDVAPSPLITHLCQTFFIHLGCNFPFLQQERFMRDLEEKQVDAILVDAVCAVAARFSTHSLITGRREASQDAEKTADRAEATPAYYGQAFAQRAKSAICDTFACPSVAVVQAALLLAYDEFGANRDSGLWMYLGISIRMAQDLGMQKLEGLKFEGRDGPTPKTVKTAAPPPSVKSEPQDGPRIIPSLDEIMDDQSIQEQRAVERERIDTFWCVFFLDRVVSSGTGRPVTLRDRDIEISFPSLDEGDPATGWPTPFPALIRIIHLYGRVTDLLNSVKEVSHLTGDVIKRLGAMESHLTDLYQGLSLRLHFNAINFQHYVKAGQGTNFILLHFWFHTLIVLLHQPTLLHTFEGKIHQQVTNSRELSMSSAKTIADILAFAELIDAKSGLGNPFTSQPIYIAACAFLKEAALHSTSSKPSSRPSTPGTHARTEELDAVSLPSPETVHADNKSVSEGQSNGERSTLSLLEQKQVAKHTLLASAANQNYQRCYRSLQSLEHYWAGTKYILTVLDQKSKGIADPLLYTREEMEDALEVPRPEPSFTSPGWRRKLSWGTYLTAQNSQNQGGHPLRHKPGGHNISAPTSPMMDPSQAIGWSLTGTMNSPSTSLAVLYQPEHREQVNSEDQPTPTQASIHIRSTGYPFPPTTTSSKPDVSSTNVTTDMPPPPQPDGSSRFTTSQGISILAPATSSSPFQSLKADPVLVSDADLLLNLHSPFSSAASPRRTMSNATTSSFASPPTQSKPLPGATTSPQDFVRPALARANSTGPQAPSPLVAPSFSMDGISPSPAMAPAFADMMIESQDIDMSVLADDVMPWLEYLPHDMLGFYDPTNGTSFAHTESSANAKS